MKLPKYEDAKNDLGYHKIDKEVYLKAREEDRPFFCHVAGKSFKNCFVYLDGTSIKVFSRGS